MRDSDDFCNESAPRKTKYLWECLAVEVEGEVCSCCLALSQHALLQLRRSVESPRSPVNVLPGALKKVSPHGRAPKLNPRKPVLSLSAAYQFTSGLFPRLLNFEARSDHRYEMTKKSRLVAALHTHRTDRSVHDKSGTTLPTQSSPSWC